MKSTPILKISMFAIPILIACCLLASGSSALAQLNRGIPTYGQSAFRHCSDRTIAGDYGFVAEGVLLPAPGVSLQFRSTGVAHFDGKGNLTWVEHTIIDGVLQQPGFGTTATGTYSVDPDCTGTAIANTPNSHDPLSFGLVIVKEGKEVRTVLDTHAITSVFTKID